ESQSRPTDLATSIRARSYATWLACAFEFQSALHSDEALEARWYRHSNNSINASPVVISVPGGLRSRRAASRMWVYMDMTLPPWHSAEGTTRAIGPWVARWPSVMPIFGEPAD